MGFLATVKGRTLTRPKRLEKEASIPLEPLARSPTTIFSLPLELLHEIFAYLVKPGYIQYDPREPDGPNHSSKAYAKHGGTAHSYQFHTNILRVNRAIGRAAAQYMHSQATFVLLTYKCAGLTAMLHRMDVPIIADQKVKFARHSFSIKLNWSINPFNTIADRRRAKLHAPKKGSALLLMCDLEKLQDVLRYHCAFLAPKRVCLISGHEPIVTKGTLSKYTPALTLRAPEEAELLNPLTEGDWTRFLSGFVHIPGIGYKLKIENSNPIALHKQQIMNKSMISSPIWPRAVWWGRFEVAHAFKQQADRFVRSGDYEAARARYEFIVCWADCDCFTTLKKIDTSRDSALLAAQERWLILLFDCCVSQSWLHLRLQDADAQYPRCGHRLTSLLARLEETWGGNRSPALDSVWSHVVLLAVVCILAKGKKSAARVPMIASELILLRKTWGQEIELHEAHDHALVESAILRAAGGEKFEVPFEDLSARILPVRIFDHQSEAKMSGRPDSLVNWKDTEHLASLTGDEQAAIATAQKKISAFDLSL